MTADQRSCEQCGTVFQPRREHARFCSPECRAEWNREHTGDLDAAASALQWSVTALSQTTRRLRRVPAWDRPRAFTVIGEAVWWVTIVDATLVRHQADAYDAVLADQSEDERELIEGTLGGLRFVRNRIGDGTDIASVVEPGELGSSEARVIDWAWRPVPEPDLLSLSQRGQHWEMARYTAYQAHLAKNTIGDTFSRAATFLRLAAAPLVPDPATVVR